MTDIRQKLSRSMGVLLAAVMLMTFTVAPTLSGKAETMPRLPDHGEQIMNAAVTIKTQKAADNIKGGIRGIDVSKYQGDINWAKVAQGDVNFAFIRATYGTTNDPMFIANATEAHENGIKVGAYHFATFKNSSEVEAEAAHFISRLKKVNITYPVVLDLESNTHKKIKKSTLTNLAIQFMDIVKAEGYTVMLYSYNNFIRDHLDASKLDRYDLWVANYIERPTTIEHKIWQHTSYGTVSGIAGRVDINIAYEDMSVNKKIRVSKEISNAIKQTLNDRYGAGLPIDGLNMDNMNNAIYTALELEVNDQWGLDLLVDGMADYELVEVLSDMYYNGAIDGNIAYLLQAKLIYKGLYKTHPSYLYDADTQSSVLALQRAYSLNETGELDTQTIQALLA